MIALLKRLSNMLAKVSPSTEPVIQTRERLGAFVYRVSGRHQVLVGILALAVAALNFAPLELQRRVIDGAIASRDIKAMLWLCLALLGIILLQSALKYALMVYQSWVGEAAIRSARHQLAQVALENAGDGEGSASQSAGVLGPEIEAVGEFVGAGISEAVVNTAFILLTVAYMLYLQPVVALGCLALLAPQLLLAPLLQPQLDRLVERQVTLVRTLGASVSTKDVTPVDDGPAVDTVIRRLFLNKFTYAAVKFALKGLLNLASSLAPLAALAAGGYFAIQGEMSVGSLVVFISGLDRLATPLRDLLNFYRSAAQVRVHHRLIVGWLQSVRAGGPHEDTEPAIPASERCIR